MTILYALLVLLVAMLVTTIMLYYGLFSRDLHILDLHAPLCSLLFVDIIPVCTTFMFHVSL